MKNILFVFVIAILILTQSCGTDKTDAEKPAKDEAQKSEIISPSGAEKPKIEGSAASVNGAEISRADLEERVSRVIGYRKASGKRDLTPDEVNKLREEMLYSLIQRELLWQESARNGVIAAPEEVEAELRREKMAFAEEEHFEQALKHQGITLEGLKSDLEKKIAIDKFLTEYVFKNKIKIEEKVIREFYDNLVKDFEVKYAGQKPPSYESQKPHIYAILRKQQEERLTEEFFETLEKNAKIETFLNLE